MPVALPDAATHAARVVDAFLEASMRPDPEAAAVYMAPVVRITFTGGRLFAHPREATAFNAARYRWVKKRVERNDVVPGGDETIFHDLGTLYGKWPDGTSFEGTRSVDRFVMRGGLIVAHDAWNDSAERLLAARAQAGDPTRN